ncbi:MAG: hypothetical protein F6K04_23025, partial [Leptolyngbya sp. SIO4C5]|nr:hypothetical protein [Leptolyngbya sp. SIO4C5]
MNSQRQLQPPPVRPNLVYRLGLRAVTAFLIGAGAIACGSSAQVPTADQAPANSEQTTGELTILWDKGYVIEEDEAIEKVVRDWAAQTGVDVNLSFYNSAEIAPKTLRSRQV